MATTGMGSISFSVTTPFILFFPKLYKLQHVALSVKKHLNALMITSMESFRGTRTEREFGPHLLNSFITLPRLHKILQRWRQFVYAHNWRNKKSVNSPDRN